tara:strand:- start:888 stop:1853 length:966 start_codon:yes stop_codon:yes gene_type:complete
MITWGMVGNSHDASLAVFDDDELLWASLAKDFSKVPNDPNFNWLMLEVARQSFGPASKIVWYERPLLKTLRQWRAGQGWLYNENNIKKYLEPWGINCKIEYTQHHLSHAAYAYYTQPYDDCAVICLDSIGEFETLTVWHGKNNKLKKIHSQSYPHSLGLFYSAMTQRMGLVPQRDEYLVTSMARKGNYKKFSKRMLLEIISPPNKDNPTIRMRENLHRGCMWWAPELQTEQDMNDIAAATQRIFELSLRHLSDWAKNKTASPNLALAGGGALNQKAVKLIKPKWKNVWVPTNPGDPGSCIGAVLAQTKTKVTLDKQWYKAV